MQNCAIAELAAGSVDGFLSVQPTFGQIAGTEFEMQTHLFIQFGRLTVRIAPGLETAFSIGRKSCFHSFGSST